MTGLTSVQAPATLSGLIGDRMRELNLSNRDVAAMSQSDPGHGTVSQGTVGQYRRGEHPDRPPAATLEVFARVLGIPLADLRSAAGLPKTLGPWTPPAEAALMDRRMRKHVDTLIKLLVRAEDTDVAA